MTRQMFKQNLRGKGSLGVTLVIAAAILIMMTGSAGATALPVNPLNFGSCPVATSGCLNGSGLSVQVLANSCINFYDGNTPDTCGVPGDTFFNSGPSDTSIFTLNTTSGTTKDLIFGTIPPIIAFLTQPGPLGTVTFDLESVVPSSQPACAANQASGACSAGVFTLVQQDTAGSNCPAGYATCGHVGVAFAFTADAYTGTMASGFTPYQIDYSSQFNNETIGDLVAKASGTNGITNSVSFTANPVSNVPEPTGFLLIGFGLIGVALVARRRTSRV